MKYIYLALSQLVLASFALATSEGFSSQLGPANSICRLLKRQLAPSSPWSSYPIVFEPINRGRLTIWTGSSNLPVSEFECYPDGDKNDVVILNYVNFASKLEWTFYDMNKGLTQQGFSINQNENALFNVTIKLGQLESYLDCNSISELTQINLNDSAPMVASVCHDCSPSSLPLIDAQIRELFKTRLNDAVLDNLYWSLAQLLTSQHFTSPISLDVDPN